MDWVLAMETMISDTSSVILGMARVAMALLGKESGALDDQRVVFQRGNGR